MTRMYFGADNCQGVKSELTGRQYNADRQGFINVSDPADVKFLKQGGYSEAGGMPHLSKYWVCDECDFEAAINHCRYCDSESLRKVEP